MLGCKYKYTGYSWMCCEHVNLLVAAFEFKYERKVKLDHSNRFYNKSRQAFNDAMMEFLAIQDAK